MDKSWLLTSEETHKTTCDLADESEHPQRWVIIRDPIDICCAQHLKTLKWMDDQMATTFTRLGNEVVAMRRGQWELLLAQARKDMEI